MLGMRIEFALRGLLLSEDKPSPVMEERIRVAAREIADAVLDEVHPRTSDDD